MNMERVAEDAEVIIRLDFADDTAHICVCDWPAYFRKCQKLYGKPLQVSKTGDKIRSAWFTCPTDRITLRKLTRPMLPDEKRAIHERLRTKKVDRKESDEQKNTDSEVG